MISCQKQKPEYPVLEAEIARKGISKSSVAEYLGISVKAFHNKRKGNIDFWWKEVALLHSLFPDVPIELLMKREDEQKNAASDIPETAQPDK